MERLTLALLIMVSLLFISSRGANVVFAAANTSSDTNPGQVKTVSKDGTVYLTTAVNKSGDTTAQAETTQNDPNQQSKVTGEKISEPTGFSNDLGSYINSVLNITMIVSLLLVFFYFISAGFQWITSGGDKSKTEEARNKIVNAVIGIIIVSASFALVGFVAYVLGFESINDALSSVKRINPV